MTTYVCFWHKAHMAIALSDVRFRGGHDCRTGPLRSPQLSPIWTDSQIIRLNDH